MPQLAAVSLMDGFSLGCDPELFILNTDGIPVPAEGLIPGTKANPYPVTGGFVQVDGCAAEVNTNPAKSFPEFEQNLTSVLVELRKMLPTGYRLSPEVSVEFAPHVWEKTPGKAKALGCSPDFNAWTGEVNPPPSPKTKPRLRCAGGHIHIGWCDNEDVTNPDHVKNCRDLIRQLDYFVGGWSLQLDLDKNRRSLYGKAGACRIKPYGVEYRTPSNFWIFDRRLRLAVWNRVNAAINAMASYYAPEMAGADYNQALIESIDNSQRNRALEKAAHFPISNLGESVQYENVSVPHEVEIISSAPDHPQVLSYSQSVFSTAPGSVVWNSLQSA